MPTVTAGCLTLLSNNRGDSLSFEAIFSLPVNVFVSPTSDEDTLANTRTSLPAKWLEAAFEVGVWQPSAEKAKRLHRMSWRERAPSRASQLHWSRSSSRSMRTSCMKRSKCSCLSCVRNLPVAVQPGTCSRNRRDSYLKILFKTIHSPKIQHKSVCWLEVWHCILTCCSLFSCLPLSLNLLLHTYSKSHKKMCSLYYACID